MESNIKALQKLLNKLLLPKVNEILKDLNSSHTINFVVGNEIGETETKVKGKDLDVDLYYVEIISDTRDLYSFHSFYCLCHLILSVSRYVISDYYALQFVFIGGGDTINWNVFYSSGLSEPFNETLDDLKQTFKELI